MQPASIQAIISATAILASGGIAVFVPWWTRKIEAKRDARRRLAVVTKFNSPSGLTVRINYFPEFYHVGIRARVSLSNTPNAVLRSGRFEHSASTLADGTHALAQFDGICVDGIALVPLIDIHNDGSLSGVVFIMPSADIHAMPTRIKRADIKIEIVTDDNTSLLKVPLVVSAISPPEAHRLDMPASV